MGKKALILIDLDHDLNQALSYKTFNIDWLKFPILYFLSIAVIDSWRTLLNPLVSTTRSYWNRTTPGVIMLQA